MTLFRPNTEARRDYPTDSLFEMLRRRQPGGTLDPNIDQALRLSAVYACVDKITSIASAFPVDVFRRAPDGTRLAVDPAPNVITSPSISVDAMDWRAAVIASWLLRGNAFGVIPGDVNGVPTGVELIDPARVHAERVRPDAPVTWKLDDKPTDLWPLGPLWHSPGRIWDPTSPLGVSILEYARRTAGLGLASSKFGVDFFGSGGHPTSLLMGDGEVNEDMAKRVKLRFRAASTDREPVVMGGAWKYQQVQVAPNESQFLETIKANATDIARFFGVPATIIDAPSGSGMTYQNAEAKADDLLKFTINGWVIRLERSLTKLLRGPYVKCNVDSLLRGDTQARYLSYDRGLRDGFLSVNDVRRLEDLPTIGPDGDEYLWPPYRAFPLATDQEST